jgi:acyl-CoA synthetase (AMP-forming)/AMP-acid ligase II
MTAAPRNVGTIADTVDRDRIAVIDLAGPAPVTLTYGDLTDRARGVARGLTKAGIGPGQRVGLLSLNRADYLTVTLGTTLAGAVLVPLNIKLPFDTLRAIMQIGEIDFLFYEAPFRTSSWTARRLSTSARHSRTFSIPAPSRRRR